MKHYFILLIFLFPAFMQIQAQARPSEKKANKKNKYLDHIMVSFTNTHIAMPFGSFSSLFYKEFHPGVEIGTGFNWSAKKKHDWIQTVKAGYSYHQFLQHSLMIYTELGYRYKLPQGFAALAKLGAGYLRSKEDSKVFVQNGKGDYVESKKFGRSHGMATLTFGVSKQLGKKGWQLLIDYQQRVQFPFIAAYVSLLPANSLSLGVSVPLLKK